MQTREQELQLFFPQKSMKTHLCNGFEDVRQDLKHISMMGT